MAYRSTRHGGLGGFGGFGGRSGLGAPPARDLVALLVAVFVTYSLQFFALTAGLVELLRLTNRVFIGFVWQIVTYPFVGFEPSGVPSLWILLILVMMFWFGGDVFWRLGRRRFWHVVLVASVGAAVAAVVLQGLLMVAGTGSPAPYYVMQGHRMLLVILVAAYATLFRDATIMFMFVIPMKARWFLWLEILVSFVAWFLPSKDLPGFVGVCVAVFLTYGTLTTGGPWRALRDANLRLRRWWITTRLARLRRRRRFDVVTSDDAEPWVH